MPLHSMRYWARFPQRLSQLAPRGTAPRDQLGPNILSYPPVVRAQVLARGAPPAVPAIPSHGAVHDPLGNAALMHPTNVPQPSVMENL